MIVSQRYSVVNAMSTRLILLTIDYPLIAVNLKPEIISQGDRELIVNMTILET